VLLIIVDGCFFENVCILHFALMLHSLYNFAIVFLILVSFVVLGLDLQQSSDYPKIFSKIFLKFVVNMF